MENEQQVPQESANQLYNYAAQLLTVEKKSPEEALRLMMEQGLDKESASVIIAHIRNEVKKIKKESGTKNMIYGALWLVGGTVVTVVTYSAASGGGTYFVAWGAIVFGGIQFVRGLINYMDV